MKEAPFSFYIILEMQNFQKPCIYVDAQLKKEHTCQISWKSITAFRRKCATYKHLNIKRNAKPSTWILDLTSLGQ